MLCTDAVSLMLSHLWLVRLKSLTLGVDSMRSLTLRFHVLPVLATGVVSLWVPSE